MNVARWLVESRCYDKGADRAEQALELATAQRANVLLPFIQEALGQAKLGLGVVEEAEKCLKTGLEIAEKQENIRAKAQLIAVYSRLELERGNSEQALLLNRQAAGLASRMSFLIMQLRLARECAALLESRNEYAAALGEHRQAWTLADKCRS